MSLDKAGAWKYPLRIEDNGQKSIFCSVYFAKVVVSRLYTDLGHFYDASSQR